MNSVVDSFLRSFAHLNFDPGFMISIVIITSGVIIFTIMALNAMVAVYFERKVSAFMQDRLGPMEVGILGFKGGKWFWGQLCGLFSVEIIFNVRALYSRGVLSCQNPGERAFGGTEPVLATGSKQPILNLAKNRNSVPTQAQPATPAILHLYIC